MKKFLNIFFALFLLMGFLLLFGCSDKKSLTVTTIHDSVIIGKSSRKDIEHLFGRPDKVEKNSSKIIKTYEKWARDETGINFSLSDGTNYWETLKLISDDYYFNNREFNIYYKYSSETLGLKSVYFFFINDKLAAFVFDDTIQNKLIAKKDKYLRQFID